MEHLIETWTVGPDDFAQRCSLLKESEYTQHNVEAGRRLTESVKTDVNEVLGLAKQLRESTEDEKNRLLLDKVIELILKNGVDSSFKVWRLPVARYDVENLNKRIYPKQLWLNIMNNQRDAWCGLCGLADHPEGDLPGLFRDQSVIWHDMEVGDDGYVYGYASFVGPYGHLAQEILEHGGRVGTSSSGFGDVDKFTRIVDPNTYQVERLADLVLNPSQGTYGNGKCTHTAADFMKDIHQPAHIEFSGNKPIDESTKDRPENIIKENNNIIPRSKVLMAKANAIETKPEVTNDQPLKENTTIENKNKLSKVEEKAFRQYVNKFLAEAGNLDNPIARLNECTDILACFEEGNCEDLREKVEAQIVAEKENLEKIVEASVKTQKDYGMGVDQFREAAERNTQIALMLNEQVTDYKALTEELAQRNSELKEQLEQALGNVDTVKSSAIKEAKESNTKIVSTLKDLDKIKEELAVEKKKNADLLERCSRLSMSNSQFQKTNGIYETKLREAAKIIENGVKAQQELNVKLDEMTRKAGEFKNKADDLLKENQDLTNAYNGQCLKFDKLNEDFNKYKEEVTDKLDPTKHVIPKAADRLGKYLNMRENRGIEIEAYWQDLKEQYGEAIEPFEQEIRGAKTLKEATNAFLMNRNSIIPEFNGTAAPNMAFRNEAERDKIYESIGMLNPKKSYEAASTDEKNEYFLNKLESQGLM